MGIQAEEHGIRPWWESAVIYQIYPRSFQDSDGDGIGDLDGIRCRLDYVQKLGVDAIWLSPIFPSPMADFGYDVSDYCGIEPMFGDLASFDALLADIHARGLKLLLDFVPNHSSTLHPWFVESRSSRDNPKRDWYIWRDPAPGDGPPNNWTSDMGGAAWEFDALTGQYYLHTFLKEQADLNWRNPDVRAAMLDVLRFWFGRGIDGFRIDVLWHCIKAQGLPDNPPNPDYRPGMGEKFLVLQTNSADQPEIHDIAHAFRQIADQYGERLLVGEIVLPLPKLMTYYGTPDRPGVQLPFNFLLLDAPWNAHSLARIIADYEAALPHGGWPNWVLGSHDAPRIAGKLGEAQARVAAMLLLTLRGTPTLYQGDELGIGRVTIPPGRERDPQDLRQPGLGLGRDGGRTPMPWDDSAHAGFSATEPWLPLNDDWLVRNVAVQTQDARSMLSLYRALLALRREYRALSVGDIRVLSSDTDVLVYERGHESERILVALNLCEQPRSFALPEDFAGAHRLLSTLDSPSLPGTLAPNEGVILRLENM
ncbi:alpha-amylase family glycosyl hydrolase [Novosphingobium sp. Leaf2]|uniref:alpha-amylase family glycosyl hydrolase n=1 Tax=Novosphingobium sp. Leaf2 TaxID=1735670 RepID=UPI0006FCA5C4|nr:alpha-amylase family glycosyl hydrolase [Novosphingobium sp. Leaf2]KQM17313.1 alpha-amylase [Novosphingobium sp. Leaf2]